MRTARNGKHWESSREHFQIRRIGVSALCVDEQKRNPDLCLRQLHQKGPISMSFIIDLTCRLANPAYYRKFKVTAPEPGSITSIARTDKSENIWQIQLYQSKKANEMYLMNHDPKIQSGILLFKLRKNERPTEFSWKKNSFRETQSEYRSVGMWVALQVYIWLQYSKRTRIPSHALLHLTA